MFADFDVEFGGSMFICESLAIEDECFLQTVEMKYKIIVVEKLIHIFLTSPKERMIRKQAACHHHNNVHHTAA